MAGAFSKLFEEWDRGNLPALPESLIRDEVLLVALQCLVQTLRKQKLNGSWGCIGPVEESSYATLTLKALLSFPWAIFFQPQLFSAIQRARSFLDHEPSSSEYLWIEKVTYRSPYLASAYVTSAQNSSTRSPQLGNRSKMFCRVPTLPGFAASIDRNLTIKEPRWLLIASWIEAELYLNRLQQDPIGSRCSFSQDETDLTLSTLFKWTLANNNALTKLSPVVMTSILPAAILIDRAVVQIAKFDVAEIHDYSSAMIHNFDAHTQGMCKLNSVVEVEGRHSNGSVDGNGGSPTKEVKLDGQLGRGWVSQTEGRNANHDGTLRPLDASYLQIAFRGKIAKELDLDSQGEDANPEEMKSNIALRSENCSMTKALQRTVSELAEFFIRHPRLMVATASMKDAMKSEVTKFFYSQHPERSFIVTNGIQTPGEATNLPRLYQDGISLLLTFSELIGTSTCRVQVSNIVRLFPPRTKRVQKMRSGEW